MNKETSKMVKGTKVKRAGCMYSINWELACEANGIGMDSVLTISSDADEFVSFNELTGYESDKWLKKYFEIVEHATVEEKKNTIKPDNCIHKRPNVEVRWCDPVGEYCIYIDGKWAGYFNLKDYKQGE